MPVDPGGPHSRVRHVQIAVLLSLCLCLVLLGAPTDAGAQEGAVRINEILASNDSSAPDEYGEFEDWIELRNVTGNTIDLTGWTLSDDESEQQPARWTFPDGTTIAPDDYLLVYASNKDPIPGSGNIHASFKLSASGEYLGLYNAQGRIIDSIEPQFPPQTTDVSWGLNAFGFRGFYAEPSPGAANGGPGVVADVAFSVDHGFFDSSFDLSLSTPSLGATIRVTTDGSEPSLGNGATYDSPIRVDETTVVRARAFLGNRRPSETATRTYLFLDDVIEQDSNPSGFPSSPVNGQEFAWGMDSDIVDGREDQVKASLAAIPTMSLVTDLDNLFDPDDGIYVNATQDGREWERPGSLELIDPSGDGPGFEINAGVRIRGGFSRRDENPKHAFRFFFRSEYGDASLQYPLFGDEGVDEFTKVDLRTAQNYSWADTRDDQNTFVREVWSRDTQRDMGQPYTRSRYYHLYVNGQYFGVFQTQERVSKEYAESYFGGDSDEYDVIKSDSGLRYATTATDGTTDAWNTLWPLVSDESVSAGEYNTISEQVDLENLADYFLLHFFSGDFDGAPSWFLNGSTAEEGPRYSRANNWQAIRSRDDGRWVFFDHDSEHALCIRDGGPDEGVDLDNTGPWATRDDNLDWEVTYFNPGWLHHALLSNDNYVQLFRDRVQKHLLDSSGALSTAQNQDRFDARRSQVDDAMLAQSARWGDGKGGSPRTVADWNAEVDFVANTCLPGRRSVALGQLGDDGLVPTLDPPTLSRPGGALPFGQTVAVVNPNDSGTVVFTTDGTDPRGLDDQPSASAQSASSFPVRDYLDVVVRVNSGGEWSAPTMVSYEPAAIPDPPAIILNEYNAVDADERLANGNSDEVFGRVFGNGGDWFELVVLEDDLDLRGWELELFDGETTTRSRDRFVLTNAAALASIPAGTIITVSQDHPDDVTVNPVAGDWTMNLQANSADDGAYITAATQENFATNADDWQLVIRDSGGNVRALRTGEGAGALTGVGPREVGKLEATPSSATTRDSEYDDGSTSTFGLPNRWDDQVQDLSDLRGFTAPSAAIAQRCLNDDGRFDVLLANAGTLGTTFDVSVTGLPTRTRQVGPNQQLVLSVTARPDGEYRVTASADGAVVESRSFTVACDPEVAVRNACLGLNGRVDVFLVNRRPAARTYNITIGTLERSRTVAANGSARVTVTGRPDGPLPVVTRRGQAIIDSSTVIVDCDPPGPEVTLRSSCLSGNGVVRVVLDNPELTDQTYTIRFGQLAARDARVGAASIGLKSVSGRPDGPLRVRVARAGGQIFDQTVTINCDLLPGSEVTVTTGCIGGLGRVDVTLFNNSGSGAVYAVRVEPLAPRAQAVAVGDVQRVTATGRPNGPISVLVTRNGVGIFNTTRTIAC